MLEMKKDTIRRDGQVIDVICFTNKRNNTNLTVDESVIREWLDSTRTSMKEGR